MSHFTFRLGPPLTLPHVGQHHFDDTLRRFGTELTRRKLVQYLTKRCRTSISKEGAAIQTQRVQTISADHHIARSHSQFRTLTDTLRQTKHIQRTEPGTPYTLRFLRRRSAVAFYGASVDVQQHEARRTQVNSINTDKQSVAILTTYQYTHHHALTKTQG